MQIEVNKRYRLKDGARPARGKAYCGTVNLQVLIFDTDDNTVGVQVEGLYGSEFWASAYDLEVYERPS